MADKQFSYARKILGTPENWARLRDRLAKTLQVEKILVELGSHIADPDRIREAATRWSRSTAWEHVAAVAIDEVVNALKQDEILPEEVLETVAMKHRRGDYVEFELNG